jgi:hypothetical protein
MEKIEEFFKNPQFAINRFISELNDQLATQVKVLLEEKHLYQKVMVNPDPIEDEIMRHVVADSQSVVRLEIRKIRRNRLTPTSGGNLRLVPVSGGPEEVIPALPLSNVRLFCKTCKERNIFAPVWYYDVSNELLKPHRESHFETTADIFFNQLVFVAFQCQLCKGLPEGFLIRRDGWRLSLDGRSPIEHVQLPVYIPPDEANLFRDALIAWFTGKQLAAVFYLRAFIEQFARRVTAMKGVRKTGDEIMETYAQTLPPDKRPHLPSLKEWYDKLSEPLHTADERAAEKLFDEARVAIENHFDIRRALKIPER